MATKTVNSPEKLYTPAEIWDPNNLSTPGLDKAVRIFSAMNSCGSEGSIILEHLIAMSLTKVTDIIRTKEWNPFSRARKAFINAQGNCIAHTEAIVAKGLDKDLEMYITWDGAHATSIFAGQAALWDVDGFLGTSNRWIGSTYNEEKDVQTFIDAYKTAGKEMISEAEGRAFFTEDNEGNISWQPIVGELGDNTSNLDKPSILLPGREGLSFLFAYADLIKFEKTNPEFAEELRPEIERFLPKTTTTLP